MTGVNRTKDISTEPHRRAEQPPRAQSPLPELKPAGRNIAPARNSLTCKAQQRIAEEHLKIAADIGRVNDISLESLIEVLKLFYTEVE